MYATSTFLLVDHTISLCVFSKCVGAGSALLGKEAAMACTVAVEDAVSEHYNDQLRTLHEPQFEKYTELRKVRTCLRCMLTAIETENLRGSSSSEGMID